MLETFVESQIYNQITIDGLNFITSVNFARILNDFGQVNLCLNMLMMSLFIFKCFFFPLRLRKQWMNISNYTQLPSDDHARMS